MASTAPHGDENQLAGVSADHAGTLGDVRLVARRRSTSSPAVTEQSLPPVAGRAG